jgi:hypothetical protein
MQLQPSVLNELGYSQQEIILTPKASSGPSLKKFAVFRLQSPGWKNAPT